MFDLHGFGDLLIKGTWITIQLAFVSWLFGMVLGLIGAAMQSSKFAILRKWVSIYTTIVRGIPEMLFVLFIGIGGALLIRTLLKTFGYTQYIEVSSFWLGVMALSIMFGAYATEVFRTALSTIPKGQWEAADSFGFTPTKTFIRIIMPQMWATALPGLSNLTLVLLKDTALISLLGLQDLMFFGQRAAQVTQKPFTFYLAIALIYLALTTLIMGVMSIAEWYANPAKRYNQKITKQKLVKQGGMQ